MVDHLALAAKQTKRFVRETDFKATINNARTGVVTNVVSGVKDVGRTVKTGVMTGHDAIDNTAVGGVLLGTTKFVGKTAIGTGKLVGKTALGTGKLVGKTALGAGKFVGGTVLEGTKLVGGTVLAGTQVVAGGVVGTLADGTQILAGGFKRVGDLIVPIEKYDETAFFEDPVEEEEVFDDDFDEYLPTRFQKKAEGEDGGDGAGRGRGEKGTTSLKKKRSRPSMAIEWDDSDWDDDKKEIVAPRISAVEAPTNSQLLELQAMNEVMEGIDEGSDGESDDDDEDMYLNEEEMKAKAKKEEDGEDSDDDEFGALGKNLMKAMTEGKDTNNETVKKVIPRLGATGTAAAAGGGGGGAPRTSVFSSMLGGAGLAQKIALGPAAGSGGGGGGAGDEGAATATTGKSLWAKLRTNVKQEAAAKSMANMMKKNTEFFRLFDEDEEHHGDPVKAAAKTLRAERAAEKKRIKALLAQLDDYEANLANERQLVKEEKAKVSKEKEELEAQLKEELEKNEDLERRVKEIDAQIAGESQAEKEAEFERELQELKAENDVIQHQLGKLDVTLRRLHQEKRKKEIEEKEKQERKMRNPTNDVLLSSMRDDDVSVISFVSRSRTNNANMSDMQHGLEEINQKVRERDIIIDKQVKEIEELRAELNKFEEENGIKPLKEKLKSLQEEKDHLVENCVAENEGLRKELEEKEKEANQIASDVSKLKLEATKRELAANKHSQEQDDAVNPQSGGGGGGFFGLFWGAPPEVEDTTEADVALSKLGL